MKTIIEWKTGTPPNDDCVLAWHDGGLDFLVYEPPYRNDDGRPDPPPCWQFAGYTRGDSPENVYAWAPIPAEPRETEGEAK